MNLPFGVQLKGFIVGVLFAMFVVPWIQSLLARNRPAAATA